LATLTNAALLDLPPGFRAIGLRELGDAFAKAVEVAAEEGAGTLVWTGRFDLVEVAVVLEPEEPLSTARRAIYAGMNAAADALAAYCPPEKPITFAWPDTILFGAGLIGGTRLAWPDGAAENEPPPWLVLGLTMRLMMHAGPASRDRTSLEAEGFEVLEPRLLIGSFARHLMVHFHTWKESGFKPIGADYLARLVADKSARRGIDGNGDLIVHRIGKDGAAERRPIVEALATCGWLDPATGEPLI
jgi:biotin-(acetyl-CoA carboxylase) ligase